MGFSPAYDDQLEIIEENYPYFIGLTDQWHDKPDGCLCFGYDGEYGRLIISAEAYEMLGDPEEYYESPSPCRKHICVVDTNLSSRGIDELHDLGWCSGCHTSAKEAWEELIENNPEVSLSGFL